MNQTDLGHFKKLLLGTSDKATPGRIKKCLQAGMGVTIATVRDSGILLEPLTVQMIEDPEWTLDKLLTLKELDAKERIEKQKDVDTLTITGVSSNHEE